jgi:hypothetical protein
MEYHRGFAVNWINSEVIFDFIIQTISFAALTMNLIKKLLLSNTLTGFSQWVWAISNPHGIPKE